MVKEVNKIRAIPRPTPNFGWTLSGVRIRAYRISRSDFERKSLHLSLRRDGPHFLRDFRRVAQILVTDRPK